MEENKPVIYNKGDFIKNFKLEVSQQEIDDFVIDIPSNILDINTYKKFCIIKGKLYAEDPDNPFTTSDPNLRVNMWASSYIVDRQIKHLPVKEQQDLKKIFKVYESTRGKLSQLKQKAGNDGANLDLGVLYSRKTEVLELFARCYSVADVHRILTTDFGFEVSSETVRSFRIRFSDEIGKLQEEYKGSINEIRLSNKKSRLEELNELYEDRKNIYEKRGKSREDFNLLLRTVEQIKKEVDGDLNINIKQDINIDIQIQEHIQMEIMKNMSIKDVILSRIAARTNQNPLYLLSRLHSSWYAKFNGFQPADGNIMEDEIIYPSKMIYDFNDIRDKVESKKHEKQQLQSLPIISEERTNEVMDLKNDIIALIKSRKIGAADDKTTFEKKYKPD